MVAANARRIAALLEAGVGDCLVCSDDEPLCSDCSEMLYRAGRYLLRASRHEREADELEAGAW